ncbi:MAG TPA: FkbM family methyltransferase [Nitrososphaeraceae archaeon]|nr:FkbM family methyltransferase [Nitrososphaeraceae archaeon]
MDLIEFRYSDFNLLCPRKYLIHLRETFILDAYQSHLLKSNDVVLDLGSTTGDFCILASRKVGPTGKVIAIEPNPTDYEILQENIVRNKCSNVTSLNIGAAGKRGRQVLDFRGTTFTFKTDTLDNIVKSLTNVRNIDFIKMDIEGYEYDVVKSSIDIFRKARVVSMEFHGTKQKIDDLLLPIGFTYHPVTVPLLFKRLAANIFSHPIHFVKSSFSIIKDNPKLIYSIPLGYEPSKNSQAAFTGYYTK